MLTMPGLVQQYKHYLVYWSKCEKMREQLKSRAILTCLIKMRKIFARQIPDKWIESCKDILPFVPKDVIWKILMTVYDTAWFCNSFQQIDTF